MQDNICTLYLILWPYCLSLQKINKYKLLNQSFHYDVRKYSFTPRIVNTWNSLPDYVVNVDSVEVFKKRLDKFWSNQPVKFDWRASHVFGAVDKTSSLVFSAR